MKTNYKFLKIGKIKLKNPLFLAPMVEVTDLAYREICKEAGAAMAYTEMIVVDSILHENDKTLSLLKTNGKDSPVGIQITGDKLENFSRVIPTLKKYDLVDINCGCPSSRIQSNESGSFLLKNPEKIAAIIKLLKAEGLTVTAKIRLGFDKNEVLKIAKIIEEAGADAITIHARLASQGNDIPADWSWIEAVKKQSRIPIIGNGDISSPRGAEKMLKICDGVMIARGAIGNPSIFNQTLSYFKTGKEPAFNFKENLQYFDKYLKLAKKYNIIDLPRIRYIGSKFLRGAPGSAKLRNEIMHLKEYEDIVRFIGNILNNDN